MSTTGYYFKFGAALSWGVKNRVRVDVLSSEADHKGMAAAAQEALYIKQIPEDFGIQKEARHSIERRQPELHQTLPKPSHAQEELTD